MKEQGVVSGHGTQFLLRARQRVVQAEDATRIDASMRQQADGVRLRHAGGPAESHGPSSMHRKKQRLR